MVIVSSADLMVLEQWVATKSCMNRECRGAEPWGAPVLRVRVEDVVTAWGLPARKLRISHTGQCRVLGLWRRINCSLHIRTISTTKGKMKQGLPSQDEACFQGSYDKSYHIWKIMHVLTQVWSVPFFIPQHTNKRKEQDNKIKEDWNLKGLLFWLSLWNKYKTVTSVKKQEATLLQ